MNAENTQFDCFLHMLLDAYLSVLLDRLMPSGTNFSYTLYNLWERLEMHTKFWFGNVK